LWWWVGGSIFISILIAFENEKLGDQRLTLQPIYSTHKGVALEWDAKKTTGPIALHKPTYSPARGPWPGHNYIFK